MLDRGTALAWTRELIAFINRDRPPDNLAHIRSDYPPLPFQHKSAAHYEQLRTRAEKTVRWLIGRKIDDSIRRGVGEQWLAEYDVTTNPEYNFIPVDVQFSYSEDGRLQFLGPPRVRSVDAYVAITIAELVSADCWVKVRQCALGNCARLFVVEPSPGRPQMCCSSRHATTLRTRRKRALDKQQNAEAERRARRMLRSAHAKRHIRSKK